MGKRITKIRRRLGKGFTLLVVPNSTGEVKSIRVPIALIITIVAIFIANGVFLIKFWMQINEIKHFQTAIKKNDQYIAQLEQERKELKPTIERGMKIAEELERIKAENDRMQNQLRIVLQRGGRVGQVSRGISVRNNLTKLNTDFKIGYQDNISLQKINQTFDQLEKYIAEEVKEQEKLASELIKIEKKLEHTPSIWPINSRNITSPFGNRFHPVYRTYRQHTGIDIKASQGTKVYSAADGKVVFSGYRGGYGYTIIIDHGYGYKTLYAHNSKLEVEEGTEIKKGQLIAFSGSTGTSNGPHLHYEVHVDGQPVNPMMFLRL
ncbi:MAG TPA: M23 family metallopeptidase [Bacillota bacterium]|jgi:murein DD-endopeptidase MepM/ murein hydrolase activator NlpD|nr:M23 family metallopeptidase [Bacillota bacterium]HOL10256.1 M23 family metallopeptidase [Bacillota bacterium]